MPPRLGQQKRPALAIDPLLLFALLGNQTIIHEASFRGLGNSIIIHNHRPISADPHTSLNAILSVFLFLRIAFRGRWVLFTLDTPCSLWYNRSNR